MFRYFRRKANRRKANRQKASRKKVDSSPPAIYINTHRRNRDSKHIANMLGSDSDIFSEFKVLTTDDITPEESDPTEEDTVEIQPGRSVLFWTLIVGLAIGGGAAVLISQTG